MQIWCKMDLTQPHLGTSFKIFFYRLSFFFNRAETSTFAHPVQILNLRELISVLYFEGVLDVTCHVRHFFREFRMVQSG
jgi:hypothetical protein